MITVNKPQVVRNNDKSQLINIIDVNGEKRELWFEAEREFEKYLCIERADAYVIGLLGYAMRNHHDLYCDFPVGESLHYQITTYLIPSLVKHSKDLYDTKIFAELTRHPLESAGAVGTGISCGIDSFHVLANQIASKYISLNITHLSHNNVGSHGIGKKAEELRFSRELNAKKVAEVTGLKLVVTNSNFAEAFTQNHLLSHTYSSTFAIYMLQKLWSIYYYASAGYDFGKFNLKDNSQYATGYYDLLSLNCFSTESLRIYSEGGAQSRFEKTKTVVNFPISRKYLNVCLFETENCGKCEKCRRTLLTLDALDRLYDYKEVFNLNDYYSHRNDYYTWLCIKKIEGDPMIDEIYQILSPKLSLKNWMNAGISILRKSLSKNYFLRKLYHLCKIKK